MADVQLLNLGNGGHVADVAGGQAVSGVDGEPGPLGLGGGPGQSIQGGGRIRELVGVLTGVELDRIDVQVRRSFDGGEVGVDEEADTNPGFPDGVDGGNQSGIGVAGGDREVQSSFRRHLLAPFGNKGRLVRSQLGREGHNIVGRGQFQVEGARNRRAQAAHVFVLNVPPILPKVDGDAIRARPLAGHRRRDGIRFVCAPRLAYRSDVVDVYKEAHRCHANSEYLASSEPNFTTAVLMAQVPRLMVWSAICASAACSSGFTPTFPIPVDPQVTVNNFMSAVQANNLVAMGRLWGTKDGPMVQQMDRAQLDMRLAVMQRYLAHDGYQVLAAEALPGQNDGTLSYRIRLIRRGCVHLIPFELVQAGGGWLVENVDLTQAGNPARSCRAPQ